MCVRIREAFTTSLARPPHISFHHFISSPTRQKTSAALRLAITPPSNHTLLQNEPPLELVVNAGTVSQYDISLVPTKPPLSAVDSLGSTNATGDASGKAADEASGTSQAGNTTSMANSEGPVRNTWVHERVVDVTGVANPKHKTTEAELLTELKSPTGVVDDADTATKAAEEPAAELGTQPSVARKKSGRVRRPVGRAAECSTGEAGRGGQEEGGCTVTVSAVPAR